MFAFVLGFVVGVIATYAFDHFFVGYAKKAEADATALKASAQKAVADLATDAKKVL